MNQLLLEFGQNNLANNMIAKHFEKLDQMFVQGLSWEDFQGLSWIFEEDFE